MYGTPGLFRRREEEPPPEPNGWTHKRQAHALEALYRHFCNEPRYAIEDKLGLPLGSLRCERMNLPRSHPKRINQRTITAICKALQAVLQAMRTLDSTDYRNYYSRDIGLLESLLRDFQVMIVE